MTIWLSYIIIYCIHCLVSQRLFQFENGQMWMIPKVRQLMSTKRKPKQNYIYVINHDKDSMKIIIINIIIVVVIIIFEFLRYQYANSIIFVSSFFFVLLSTFVSHNLRDSGQCLHFDSIHFKFLFIPIRAS